MGLNSKRSSATSVAVGLALAALILAGCSGAGAAAPSSSGAGGPTAASSGGGAALPSATGLATILPAGGPTDAAFDLDPASPKCAGPDRFGVTPTKLPVHWPDDVPVIPGTCIASFELADSTGGYALEVSVALSGSNVDFDHYTPWQVANTWLVDAGMEAVSADSGAGGSRQALYRKGLVTSTAGDDFYHEELRLSAQETPDGYVVIQYLLNLLGV